MSKDPHNRTAHLVRRRVADHPRILFRVIRWWAFSISSDALFSCVSVNLVGCSSLFTALWFPWWALSCSWWALCCAWWRYGALWVLRSKWRCGRVWWRRGTVSGRFLCVSWRCRVKLRLSFRVLLCIEYWLEHFFKHCSYLLHLLWGKQGRMWLSVLCVRHVVPFLSDCSKIWRLGLVFKEQVIGWLLKWNVFGHQFDLKASYTFILCHDADWVRR